MKYRFSRIEELISHESTTPSVDEFFAFFAVFLEEWDF